MERTTGNLGEQKLTIKFLTGIIKKIINWQGSLNNKWFDYFGAINKDGGLILKKEISKIV